MNDHRLTAERLEAFARYLRAEERSPGTIENYRRAVGAFAAWLNGRPVRKELAARWRDCLLAQGAAPATVNSRLAALNTFFRFAGWDAFRVRALRLQHRLFREPGRELTREEYLRLLAAAGQQGRPRLALLMEAICATGVRVSEVRYLTVEAARRGRAEIFLKGKARVILLPGKLCRKLLQYAKREKIASGELFLTKGGRGLSRKQIWAEMKSLCEKAGVAAGKVFPHNLRHLFATAFYRVCRDMARLADVLGHSSIETTRIYLRSTGSEHLRCLDRMGLVS